MKLSRYFFLFCVLCLFLALFSDLPFFWYVKTFGLQPSIYYPIVDFLENSIPFLSFPASFAVFSLIKLHRLENKTKNFDKSKEYAAKAEKALEVKEDDGLGCF